jgi:hypothetical protein
MVDDMAAQVPPDYLDGIAAIEVSPRTVPHPERAGVYTMGECVPIDVAGDPAPSRVVLYHGSFRALAAERTGFDWRAEAWETLTHELRHHLEWRAQAPDLERYDWAAEQSFARSEGDRFDPAFYLAGESLGGDRYQVEDDVYFDREVRRRPDSVTITWAGRHFRVPVPAVSLPAFLTLDGLPEPPPGDAFLVIRRKPRILDLFRAANLPTEARVRVEPVADESG